MSIEDLGNRNHDFQVAPGRGIVIRRHRHSRGEEQGRPPRPDHSSTVRALDQYHHDEIEDALDEGTPVDEPQVEDIAPDWQALRQHGTTASEPAYRPEDSEPTRVGSWTDAQHREVQHTETLRYFGQFGQGRR